MRFFVPLLLMAALGCQGESAVKSPRSATGGNQETASPDSTVTKSIPDPNQSQRPGTEPANDFENELKILHWNIESGGSDPNLIADQLAGFAVDGSYQVFALSEVDKPEVYHQKFDEISESGRWGAIVGKSGGNEGREDDRLMILFDTQRLKLLEDREMNRHGEYPLNTGRHRSPMAGLFECRQSGEKFIVLHNHLARGDAEFRAQQAVGLREFARDSALPVIAVGDYNFDYVFATKTGNQGFVEFMRDGVWKWIEPEELVDTNWFDPEPDGVDNYPGSMLDFTFVSGKARDWNVTSKVVVRDGDFPDDQTTSDHRPVEVVVRY